MERRLGDPLQGGSIAGSDLWGLDYELDGKTIRVPTDDIALVVTDAAPTAFRAALEAQRAGDPRSAVRLYQLARTQAPESKRVVGAASFEAARIGADLGRADRAMADLEKALPALQGTWLEGPAVILRGRLLAESGKADEAGLLIGGLIPRLLSRPGARHLGLSARRTQGEILLSAGQPELAVEAFDRLHAEAAAGEAAAQSDGERALFREARAFALKDLVVAGLLASDREGAEARIAALAAFEPRSALAEVLAEAAKAEIALSTGEPDRAVVILKGLIATRFDAESAMPYLHLGLVRAHLAQTRQGAAGADARARDTLAVLRRRHPGAPETARAERLIKELP